MSGQGQQKGPPVSARVQLHRPCCVTVALYEPVLKQPASRRRRTMLYLQGREPREGCVCACVCFCAPMGGLGVGVELGARGYGFL